MSLNEGVDGLEAILGGVRELVGLIDEERAASRVLPCRADEARRVAHVAGYEVVGARLDELAIEHLRGAAELMQLMGEGGLAGSRVAEQHRVEADGVAAVCLRGAHALDGATNLLLHARKA